MDWEIDPYVLFYELRKETGEPGQTEEYEELKRVFFEREQYYKKWQNALKRQSVENVYNISVPQEWGYKDFWFADMGQIETAKWALLAKYYQPAEELELEYEAPDMLLRELIGTQEEILKEMRSLLAEVQGL